MRPYLALVLATTALSTLVGCASSGDVPPDRPVQASAAAMKPTARPVDLPTRPMTMDEVERAWAADRAALAAAGDVNDALRDAIGRRQ